MVIIVGTDDAGRGPCIGPMVIAGVSVDEKELNKLSDLGVKDSKLLTPKQREFLYDKIIEVVKNYKAIVVPASEVDNAVESETTNLNWLESEKFAMVINYLKPDRAIVDCPSPNIPAYTEHLRTFLKVKTHLQCSHKADLKFVVVGAASIIAKVTRDREVAKLREKYGDFGSGYPSDPKTKEYLAKNWKKHPEIFRKSWACYKKYSGEKKQSSLADF